MVADQFPYVIYLYRKLRAEYTPQPTATNGGEVGFQGEIDRLNAEISKLERRLTGRAEEAKP